MHIRKYSPSDRPKVEMIHFETGFLGTPMSKLLTDNNLYKKTISYYLDKEPESIFVLEKNKKIAGYLLGCIDDNRRNELSEAMLQLPQILIRSILLPKKDRMYWLTRIALIPKMISGRSGELKLKYPEDAGHFHINILPNYRGKGYGTRLLREFEKYAKNKSVKIIHASGFQTRLNPNTHFWYKNGFKVFSIFRSYYWEDYYPDEEMFVVCYSKYVGK